uniref:Uncharacterized protein n=1 Tax=Rhizophora mucronata TaxID=61149 RepID=A0A2P2KQ97_RHIMU
MDAQVEKVYVALGNDLQDGFKTLDWTLGKWKSKSISIVILHFAYNISHDFVYTPRELKWSSFFLFFLSPLLLFLLG